MTGWSTLAPDAARTLDEVERAAWVAARDAGIGDLVDLMSRVCAAQVGLRPLEPEPGVAPQRWAGTDAAAWRSIDDLATREVTALTFAEQFSVDVASIAQELRSELVAGFGAEVGDLAAMLFVVDFLPRTGAGLEALRVGELRAGSAGASGTTGATTPGIWAALDAFTRAVPVLGSLDPVVTELVRLRGASQHHCRLCASLRSRPALLAGTEESTFAALLADETSGLSSTQRAAVAFTDAMIWTPAALPPDVVTTLQQELSEEQRAELVLDITRNALNKVAVALGADDPHVETGVEIYDVDPEGNLLYGLTLD
jgi:alkylhydroperoxidase family enzyme